MTHEKDAEGIRIYLDKETFSLLKEKAAKLGLKPSHLIRMLTYKFLNSSEETK